MVESSTPLFASFIKRRHNLGVAAYAVRQRATQDGYDFTGWRLSRLMRDAETDAQVNFAEQKYIDWQHIN
jgi:hypothetical protein